MIKKGGIYLFLAVFTLALFMLLEYNKPKEVNWFPSYATHHKIPYGTKVINTIMEQRFGSKMIPVFRPPYEYLKQNDSISGTYFLLNNAMELDKTETEKLLDWTAEGNTLFLAGSSFGQSLSDELNFETKTLYSGELEHNFYMQLVNSRLKTEHPAVFSKDFNVPFFNEIDTLNTSVLGVIDSNKAITLQNANIIKQVYGKGTVILCLFPKAFTNFFILENEVNTNYTAGVLSYLDPTKNIYVDNHHKTGKTFYTSPMRIFLSAKELKWAYYMVLLGVLFYVFFEGKRKQRAIPIVMPLQNQTLAFTRTIADMYYEKSRQKEIAEHKVNFFMEYVRSKFHVNTFEKNDDFYSNIASRSFHTKEEVKQLFAYLEQITKASEISNEHLKKLNTTIEEFKVKANGRK